MVSSRPGTLMCMSYLETQARSAEKKLKELMGAMEEKEEMLRWTPPQRPDGYVHCRVDCLVLSL